MTRDTKKPCFVFTLADRLILLLVAIAVAFALIAMFLVPSGHAQMYGGETLSEQLLKESAATERAQGQEGMAQRDDFLRRSLQRSRLRDEAYRPVIVVPPTAEPMFPLWRPPVPRLVVPVEPAPTDPFARFGERGRR